MISTDPTPSAVVEIPQVRGHKLEVLREVVENYDYDGLDMEFSETLLFPVGRQ